MSAKRQFEWLECCPILQWLHRSSITELERRHWAARALGRMLLREMREWFHRTILQKFYQITFRKKLYEIVEALLADLDEWLDHYNT